MNQTLPLKNVRAQLSDLISRVAYGNQKVVITKFGKPVAALVTFEDYEKIMNPAKRYTKKEWEKGFSLMDKARANAKKFPQREVEQAIDQTVSKVRQTKRV
ncbi:type II toxin-antitoxin system Phd/YefM family antitoxin [Patescibacteria group bacterium]|nr:type II toxin-antitoxin system Phd/YefM family antitoxin [Patescibacteria group bacterium]MBU4016695.1 type II toxin-antitoxin system Phd/YefM family antitoxin [Patescibacteria group bacterium]